jgi:ribonucleotide monophosphatase NagD (HAD superfamily)
MLPYRKMFILKLMFNLKQKSTTMMLITNQTMSTHASNEEYLETLITKLDKDNIAHDFDCRLGP